MGSGRTTTTRSRPRRLLRAGIVASAVLLAILVLLAVEAVAGARGIVLEERDPHTMDGVVRGDASDGRDGDAGSGAPLRILWLGDSTAAGVGTSNDDGAVARQVARRLAQQLGRPVELWNHAVSGARIADVRDRQLPGVRAAGRTPDLVLLSIGANDATHLTSDGSFRDAYEAVVAGVPAGADLVVIGVPDLGSATRLAQPLRAITSWRGDQLGAIARDVATAHDLAYVNLSAQTGPPFRADPGRLLAADGYHPSDAGYGIWADAIVPVVEWQLARREHPERPAPPRPPQSL